MGDPMRPGGAHRRALRVRRSALAVLAVPLLLAACAGSQAGPDGLAAGPEAHGGGVATEGEGSEEVDGADDGSESAQIEGADEQAGGGAGQAGSGGQPRGGAGGSGGGGRVDDPAAPVAWFLTPAGPESPSVNEDSAYKTLDDNDPARCAGLLGDGGLFSSPPPAGFGTGERSYHLFRAGAHLCTGDIAEGKAAYRQAAAAAWIEPNDPVVHSRVCNVWVAVTRMIDPDAGPCRLQLAAGTDPRGGQGEADPGEADPGEADPAEAGQSEADPPEGDGSGDAPSDEATAEQGDGSGEGAPADVPGAEPTTG